MNKLINFRRLKAKKMKKSITILCLLFTNFVFSQEKQASTYKQLPRSQVSITAVKQPVFFINGKEVNREEVIKLKHEDIYKMEVTKNNPKYPNGLVTIMLKK